ncbi:DUF3786 domain-containing protein [Natroniella sulfidigena]|uniref:DUF3786 domain-containing protein n=1 Tax=Natroniella sulfidigena TaxID=723921 RepID=UPI00200B1D74|nr:DUF3786 domain-containing protein [Natroniella sulfidigena]MCK8818007.1 DUF3786 domain-containing protein [Natroniella sulfidigena]
MTPPTDSSITFESDQAAGYKPAIEKAKQRLARTPVQEITDRTGIKFIEDSKQFILPALNKQYYIEYPTGKITSPTDNEIKSGLKIVILHYLLRANDWPLKDKLIPYRKLPGGTAYNAAFEREAINPISDNFCSDPEQLKSAAQKLGAKFLTKGDLSFTIEVLPSIPLTYILWKSDDELPGSSNILFDSSAITKLHTEDLAFLGEYTTYLLLKHSEQ